MILVQFVPGTCVILLWGITIPYNNSFFNTRKHYFLTLDQTIKLILTFTLLDLSFLCSILLLPLYHYISVYISSYLARLLSFITSTILQHNLRILKLQSFGLDHQAVSQPGSIKLCNFFKILYQITEGWKYTTIQLRGVLPPWIHGC